MLLILSFFVWCFNRTLSIYLMNNPLLTLRKEKGARNFTFQSPIFLIQFPNVALPQLVTRSKFLGGKITQKKKWAVIFLQLKSDQNMFWNSSFKKAKSEVSFLQKTSFHRADAKRNPFYSSDLHFSVIKYIYRSNLLKSEICNIGGVQYV